jgi:hypothetical protein
MRRAILIPVVTLVLGLASQGVARAETAIGAVFGYPGNVGLSMRFDVTPINVAWSDDFIHGTIDRWMKKKPLEGGDGKLSWYLGVGADAGIPLDDAEEFFLAARVPIGLQFMFTPKLEGFGEVAAGLQLLDETDFYWASSVGIRFVLGK